VFADHEDDVQLLKIAVMVAASWSCNKTYASRTKNILKIHEKEMYLQQVKTNPLIDYRQRIF